MKHIAFTRNNPGDEGVSIMTPVISINDIGFTEETAFERAYNDHLPEVLSTHNGSDATVIDSSKIPASMEFRDAWVLNKGDISEDLEKSINIKLKSIRNERQPLLEALDVESTRAMENGDTELLKSIVINKQKLRDATEALKSGSIKNIDELRGRNLNDYIK